MLLSAAPPLDLNAFGCDELLAGASSCREGGASRCEGRMEEEDRAAASWTLAVAELVAPERERFTALDCFLLGAL